MRSGRLNRVVGLTIRKAVKRHVLAILAYTRGAEVFKNPSLGGVGSILTFHRVVEHYEEAALQKDMVVTARFLDQVVRYVRSKGYVAAKLHRGASRDSREPMRIDRSSRLARQRYSVINKITQENI